MYASMDEKIHRLRQIADSHGTSAIPVLLALLCSVDKQIADAASERTHQIVQECDPSDLCHLDTVVRQISVWDYSEISASDAIRLSGGLTGTLGILSFHRSGFVREAAVAALAGIHDGRELAFLLIRMNDWVLPIREAAGNAVIQRLGVDYVSHFVNCLPLIDRLQHQRRVNQGPLANEVSKLLLSDAGLPALRNAVMTGSQRGRRLAFRVLVQQADDRCTSVLRELLNSNDPVMRFWSVRELRSRLEGPSLREILVQFRNDRFMPARREAIYAYVEKLPELAPAELLAALFDRSAAIRELARFHLRQSGEQDFVSLYRRKLEQGDGELATAITGLSETGSAVDAARLAPFLKHSDSRVRTAAVRAVGRLDADGFCDPLFTALQDTSPGVAKAVGEVFRRKTYLLSPSRLWSAFQGAGVIHVRQIALSLLASLQWWEIAPMLIAANRDEDPKIAERATELLRKLAKNPNHLTVRPTVEQLWEFERALKELGAYLEEPIASGLSSLLHCAKGK